MTNSPRTKKCTHCGIYRPLNYYAFTAGLKTSTVCNACLDEGGEDTGGGGRKARRDYNAWIEATEEKNIADKIEAVKIDEAKIDKTERADAEKEQKAKHDQDKAETEASKDKTTRKDSTDTNKAQKSGAATRTGSLFGSSTFAATQFESAVTDASSAGANYDSIAHKSGDANVVNSESIRAQEHRKTNTSMAGSLFAGKGDSGSVTTESVVDFIEKTWGPKSGGR